jgi:hypothetical protein
MMSTPILMSPAAAARRIIDSMPCELPRTPGPPDVGEGPPCVKNGVSNALRTASRSTRISWLSAPAKIGGAAVGGEAPPGLGEE